MRTDGFPYMELGTFCRVPSQKNWKSINVTDPIEPTVNVLQKIIWRGGKSVIQDFVDLTPVAAPAELRKYKHVRNARRSKWRKRPVRRPEGKGETKQT